MFLVCLQWLPTTTTTAQMQSTSCAQSRTSSPLPTRPHTPLVARSHLLVLSKDEAVSAQLKAHHSTQSRCRGYSSSSSSSTDSLPLCSDRLIPRMLPRWPRSHPGHPSHSLSTNTQSCVRTPLNQSQSGGRDYCYLHSYSHGQGRSRTYSKDRPIAQPRVRLSE